jgi:SIR2-like domain
MATSARTIDEFPFDPIAKDLREGRCIPFLGAGASSFPKELTAKPPTAAALARELAEEWVHPQFQVFRDLTDSNDPAMQEQYLRAQLDCENLMLVSSWVEHGLGDRSRLDDKLREYLADKLLPFNALHDLLARVAWQKPMAIITTNYDDLIEQALVERQVSFDLFVVAIDRPAIEGRPQGTLLFRPAGQDELQPVTGEHQILEIEIDGGQVRLKRTALFKIHGHIDRRRGSDDTFVITEEDYVSFLGRMGSGESVIPAELVTMMQKRTLLFLGYSLRDWNFRVLLDRMKNSSLQPRRSYAVCHGIDPAESELWGARKVAVFEADLNEFVPRLDTALDLPPSQ